MNRKRALYCYEFGNIKWMFLAGMVCCFLALASLNSVFSANSYSDLEYGMYQSISTNILNFNSFSGSLSDAMQWLTVMAEIAISIMVMIQFADYHKRNRREYMISLPFTQRERFLAKYFVGVGLLTVISVVFAGGVCLLRQVYFYDNMSKYLVCPEYKIIYGNDTWLHTLRTLFMFWLILITAYTVLTAVHSLITKGVLASIISLCMLATPLYILYVVKIYYLTWLSYASDVEMSAQNHFFEKASQLCGSFIGQGYTNTSETLWGNSVNIQLYDYGVIWGTILVLAVVAALFFLLAYRVNIMQDSAKFGCVIPKNWVRNVVSAGMAICFSFPIACLLLAFVAVILFVSVSDLEEIHAWSILLIVQIVLAIGLYLVNRLLFKIKVK